MPIPPPYSGSSVAAHPGQFSQFNTAAWHHTIQIFFHPAKEANKCAKISEFYAASPHSDRLTACEQKINVISMPHGSALLFEAGSGSVLE